MLVSRWLPGGRYAAAHPCEACHREIVATFRETAHFRTSADASAPSIRGQFAAGRNVMRTGSPGIYFRMERRDNAFYRPRSTRPGAVENERIDLVVGSGRRGQTYLYWRGGLLFEVARLVSRGIERWINSPGYVDGQIDFGRLIVPHCLECHSTSFPIRTVARRRGTLATTCSGSPVRNVMGTGAPTCVSDVSSTERRRTLHSQSRRFSRDRKVDNCALCHAGERDPKVPPFSYRPGDKLDDYSPPREPGGDPDVHGIRCVVAAQQVFSLEPGHVVLDVPRRPSSATRRDGVCREVSGVS